MAFKLTRLLTPEAQQRIAEHEEYALQRRIEYANLSDENLVASARYYMKQMAPLRWAPGEPVYDATFWHITIPEMLRRLATKEPSHD